MVKCIIIGVIVIMTSLVSILFIKFFIQVLIHVMRIKNPEKAKEIAIKLRKYRRKVKKCNDCGESKSKGG